MQKLMRKNGTFCNDIVESEWLEVGKSRLVGAAVGGTIGPASCAVVIVVAIRMVRMKR